jgi:pimeloyl-ACP methyl ester carboxylesterase
MIRPFLRTAALAVFLPLHTSLASPAPGQDTLPRRAALGAALEPATDGVRIREVFAGSSAEAAGLRAGDLIEQLGEAKVTEVGSLIRAMRGVSGGAELEIRFQRQGESQSTSTRAKEWPREPENEAYRVEYGSLPSKGGRLRTITLVPKTPAAVGSKHPAMLIIQGLGAVSLDNPKPGEAIDQPTGMGCYRTIADAIANDGYIVMRVDKAGCGDSQGDASKLDFDTELDGYRQALAALRNRDDVDSGRLFVFGHSMGGVYGPMLAAEKPVRGVAVYGTLVKPWVEYLAENSRRQTLLAGASPADYDRLSRLLEKFNHEYLVNNKSPEQVLTEHSELSDVRGELSFQGDLIFGRHYSFFQQLQEVNLPEQWANLDAHVLALWGTADFVSGRDDHELIASIANSKAEGKGKFVAVPQSDHGFGRAGSAEEALEAMSAGSGQASRFNLAVIEPLRGWLRTVAG